MFVPEQGRQHGQSSNLQKQQLCQKTGLLTKLIIIWLNFQRVWVPEAFVVVSIFSFICKKLKNDLRFIIKLRCQSSNVEEICRPG